MGKKREKTLASYTPDELMLIDNQRVKAKTKASKAERKAARQRSRQANSGAPNGQYPRPHSSDQGMAAEERKGALSESVQGPRRTKRRCKNPEDTSTGGDHKGMELQEGPWRLAPEEVVRLELQ